MPVLTLAQQRDAALASIRLHGQLSLFPRVEDEEMNSILEACLQAKPWEDATDYEVNDIVIPTKRNRHAYRCIQQGESAATEPTWPLVQSSTVTDGTGDTEIIWQEIGPDTNYMFKGNLYQWDRALNQIFLLKAERSLHLHDTRRSQSSSDKSQLHAQFLKMAQAWQPIRIR